VYIKPTIQKDKHQVVVIIPGRWHYEGFSLVTLYSWLAKVAAISMFIFIIKKFSFIN
jgi:hypothetical protein